MISKKVQLLERKWDTIEYSSLWLKSTALGVHGPRRICPCYSSCQYYLLAQNNLFLGHKVQNLFQRA